MPDLEELRSFGSLLIRDIQSRILGRIAHEHFNCNYLAWAIAQAGDGDHLEIGSLFGGSAILAALIKEKFGFDGKVVCVDPFDGYYVGTEFESPVDPVTELPITEEVFWSNARKFRVDHRLEVVKASSIPWPEELAKRSFSSAFIDGDHWGEAPLTDWENASLRTTKYVVFDNFDAKHPAVQRACEHARLTEGWSVVLESDITFILRRDHAGHSNRFGVLR